MTLPDSTADLTIPSCLIDQVIGQRRATEIVKLAAKQRRFILLIGEPGTGKSLIARTVAELLPAPGNKILVAVPGTTSPTRPQVLLLDDVALDQMQRDQLRLIQRAVFSHNILIALVIFASLIVLWTILRNHNPPVIELGGYLLAGIFALILYGRRRGGSPKKHEPKILCRTNDGSRSQDDDLSELRAPFIDATGFKEGALFGDIRHDPYQSGGAETPPHLLVEPGAIHRAHGGVLFIDEIAGLSHESQRLLLTAIQEKNLPITGRHYGSSGTMIHTNPVPCDFVLVAAGNRDDLTQLLPALRSRIQGYGYEILTNQSMPDTQQNQSLVTQFVAQEVRKDGRIPHFASSAIKEIFQIARMRAPAGHLTLRLRELGGVVRIAGDLAVQDQAPLVKDIHVRRAGELALGIERQSLLS